MIGNVQLSLILVEAAPAQTLLRIFCCPKSFVHPILSLRAEGVFRRSFSPRAQIQNAKVGWELAVDF